MAFTTKLPLEFASDAISKALIENVKHGLRQRVLEQFEKEINPLIDQFANELALKVSEMSDPRTGDLYIQMAINGKRIPDREITNG